MSLPPDLATVEASFFEPLLHEKFPTQLWNEHHEPVPLDFELVGVLPVKLLSQPGSRAPFSLLFDGAPGAALEQGIYSLSHPATGEMELFLVPLELRGDRLRLEAVLN